jgi:hypothetical protein
MIEKQRFFLLLFATLFVAASAMSQAVTGPPKLEAYLTVLPGPLHSGDTFKVRAEIKNISDHPILVGRDLNLVSNMPYRMDIRLQDSTGQQLVISGGAAVDFLDLSDLQVENAILK